MLLVQIALAFVLGYLYGSVPSAYLLVRLTRGIDLRNHGTGNIGISNAVQQAGAWVAFPLIVYDVFIKGWLPVFLASGVLLKLGVPTQIAIGVGVIAGHNWPAYLRFQGGRGLAPSLGVLLALHWPLLLAFGGVAAAIWATTRNSPIAWFVATLALPALAAVMQFLPADLVPIASIRPPGWMVLFGVIYVFLVLFRRLLGSWPGGQQPRPNGVSWTRIAINRLVLDRDTASREEWIKRRPAQVSS